MTCPAGHTTRIRPGGTAPFSKRCNGCPLRARCTTSERGRTIKVDRYHNLRAKKRCWVWRLRPQGPMRTRRNAEHLPDLPATRRAGNRLAHPPPPQTRTLPRASPQPAMAHHPNSSHQPTNASSTSDSTTDPPAGYSTPPKPPNPTGNPHPGFSDTSQPATSPDQTQTPPPTHQHSHPNTPIISRLLEPSPRSTRSGPSTISTGILLPWPRTTQRTRTRKTAWRTSTDVHRSGRATTSSTA